MNRDVCLILAMRVVALLELALPNDADAAPSTVNTLDALTTARELERELRYG